MHHLALQKREKETLQNFATEEAGVGEQDTKELSQCLNLKKGEKEKKRGMLPFLLFLPLPRCSARVESLHVDHGLPSEGALAVVDRDEACDGSHSYSAERGEGGACFPADSLNSVYFFHIQKGCSVV